MTRWDVPVIHGEGLFHQKWRMGLEMDLLLSLWSGGVQQSDHMKKWEREEDRQDAHEMKKWDGPRRVMFDQQMIDIVVIWVAHPTKNICFLLCHRCLLGRCVSSLKNLFFMLLNWWLEWWEGGGGAGRSFSLSSSSSAALRKRGPATLTNRIAALEKAEGRGGNVSNSDVATWASSFLASHEGTYYKTCTTWTMIRPLTNWQGREESWVWLMLLMGWTLWIVIHEFPGPWEMDWYIVCQKKSKNTLMIV